MIYYSMEWTISNKILINIPTLEVIPCGDVVTYVLSFYSLSSSSARMAPMPRATLMPQPAMDPK